MPSSFFFAENLNKFSSVDALISQIYFEECEFFDLEPQVDCPDLEYYRNQG